MDEDAARSSARSLGVGSFSGSVGVEGAPGGTTGEGRGARFARWWWSPGSNCEVVLVWTGTPARGLSW